MYGGVDPGRPTPLASLGPLRSSSARSLPSSHPLTPSSGPLPPQDLPFNDAERQQLEAERERLLPAVRSCREEVEKLGHQVAGGRRGGQGRGIERRRQLEVDDRLQVQ